MVNAEVPGEDECGSGQPLISYRQLRKMYKSWLQSKTIRSALVLFAVPCINLGMRVYEEKAFTETHAIELGALLTGFYKLVEGRVEAKDDLLTPALLPGRTEAPAPPPWQAQSLLGGAALAQAYVDEARGGLSVPTSEIALLLGQADESLSNGEVDSLDVVLNKGSNLSYKVVFNQDSVIKTSLTDSSLLGPESLKQVAKGVALNVFSYQRDVKNHVKVQFAEEGPAYYLYIPHFALSNRQGVAISLADHVAAKPASVPQAKVAAKVPERRTAIKLPTGVSVFLEDPILPGGHFSWAEATKGWSRPLTTVALVNHVKEIAKTLEDVRTAFGGRPITVTSWYRDLAANRACGGSSRSRHLTGGAVDFYIQGISEKRVFDYLEKKGFSGGLATKPGVFVHVDDWMGTFRRWSY